MRLRLATRYLTLAILFVAFLFRFETDSSGHWVLVPPYAHAKSGPGSDGDGGDDGEGDDGGDDGEGDDGGDDGEGDDGGDDGEGDDEGDDSEGDDDGDDGEGDDDDGDDDEGEDDNENGHSREQSARPVGFEKLSNGARVIYSDGSREEIRDGNFSRTNANGRIVERRSARGSDLARMRAYFSQTATKSQKAAPVVKSRAVKATYRGRNVEILYANGWREEIKSGRFTLTDKYGRVVTSRRATPADVDRLNRFRK